MERLKPPKPFDFEGNVPEKWKLWKEDLEWYLIATDAEEKTEKVKSGILLHSIGSKGKEIYNTFEFEAPDDKFKYTKILEKFEAYCTPRKNLTLLRFKFLTYRQGEEESFDQFVTYLKKMSSTCELLTLKESLIKDMIIIGTTDKKLQERLLKKSDISLDDTIKEGKASELSKKYKKHLQADTIRNNRMYGMKVQQVVTEGRKKKQMRNLK